MLEQSLFTIELYNKLQQRTAIISSISPGCSLAQSRNEADEISWNVPLEALDDYARRNFTTAENLLVPRETEVRIKYDGILQALGELTRAPLNINQDGLMLNLQAEGILNWLADRYLEEDVTYTNVQATQIAANLINLTQNGGDDWDFDITIGNLASVGTHTITYKSGTNIKDALQNLTKRATSAFDFVFTPQRVFNTYPAIGSARPDIQFSYPGNILPGSKIEYFGTEMANRILVYGSGISAEAAPPFIVNDFSSQHRHKVRQARLVLNEVSEDDTLESHGRADLAARANPIKLPVLKVDGNTKPHLTAYSVGDYVKVKTRLGTYMNQTVMMRLERRELDVDKDGVITISNYVSY